MEGSKSGRSWFSGGKTGWRALGAKLMGGNVIWKLRYTHVLQGVGLTSTCRRLMIWFKHGVDKETFF